MHNNRKSPIAAAFVAVVAMTASACVSATETDQYIEIESVSVMDAPSPRDSDLSDEERDRVMHGKYLIELLGCGACHTDGALIGAPDSERLLAGSRVGIAIDSPLDRPFPAVTYPPNLTPDDATGLGRWSDEDIARAIRAGTDRHGRALRAVMPWGGYARISDSDIDAIVAYLRNIEPVGHNVPAPVPRGREAKEDFVYFGVYQTQ